MIPLCERCKHYDWVTMRKIIDVWKNVGLGRPKHIWCDVNDQPEDLRYESCENFDSLEEVA